MYSQRKPLYEKLEQLRGSKVITYITGERPGMEAQISPEALNHLPHHLDILSNYDGKISLILSSRGGMTLAGWGLVNLIRMYCEKFEVIIPARALSAATLISIGADCIVMTKQATLGPIDPSINGPFNPPVQGMPPNVTLPVSVEDVTKYFELARKEIGDIDSLLSIFSHLTNHVHPLALGSVYRSRTQIQMLAKRLLNSHIQDEKKVNEIISFLCSDSGSHDYTINRREAKRNLHLPVEVPTPEEYLLIRDIYADLCAEMSVDIPFAPAILLGQLPTVSYSTPRVILESIAGGSHRFVSEGSLSRIQSPPPPPGMPFAQMPQALIQDERTFEAWKHEQ